MLVETAAPPAVRTAPRVALLVGIPVGFAVLGFGLRLIAYLQAGWEPHLSSYPGGLCRWDCLWYVNLASKGYDAFPTALDAGNWAFFPLLPLLVGTLHRGTGLPVMDVASGLSILFSIAATLVAWPLLERRWRAYTLYAAFLLCGPFSIYFTTFYTEVLFVLLTNCVLLMLRRSRWLAAGGFGALLSATRIVGVFIVFAIALDYVLKVYRRSGTVRELVLAVWRDPAIVLALLVAPLGAFAYMAYLYHFMGDALAFSHVQRAWGRVTENPLLYLWIGLTDLPKSGFWPTASQWLALSALLGLGLSGVLAWRRRYPEALFCLICLIVPLSVGMASMLRFVVALSPLVLLAMALLGRWKPLFAVALVGFVAADYVFTLGWLWGWLALV